MTETHGTFAQLRTAAAPALRPVCDLVRALIRDLDPECFEVVWPRLKIASFGVGPKKTTQHYAYLGVQKAHVNLGFYRGASLGDPARLLEGTGKDLRPVKLRTLAEARRRGVRALLVAAIRDREPHRGRA